MVNLFDSSFDEDVGYGNTGEQQRVSRIFDNIYTFVTGYFIREEVYSLLTQSQIVRMNGIQALQTLVTNSREFRKKLNGARGNQMKSKLKAMLRSNKESH